MGFLNKSVAALSLATMMSAAGQASAEGLLIYVSPDPIGVNAFLAMGKTGIEAAGEKHDMDVKTYESSTAAERRDNVSAAVNEGADIVVMLGFEFNDIVAELAPTAPDTQFLIVDQCIENRPDNVHCAVFREYEASYLMGVAAGMLTESNTVGVVGALDIPFLHRYTDGYAQGVESVNPEATVEVRWVGGENPFSDPVRAKEQALALHSAGADYIYTATSGGDFGVFEAAKEEGFKTFAVDINHCPTQPGVIVDQSLKQVDVALVAAVDAILEGQPQTFSALGIKEGGVGAIALDEAGIADSGCLIADHPEVAAKLREVAAGIADGSIELTDPMQAN
ncbi:BMP family ABC transporter substrate-binding protein [Mesorhizobium sp. CAU 1741]|uniref:BMP family ABC transporter substrate-binding protein n=1 Tax=Mesorhizobium sp. CAU 1741 TaxID=3140366 RepID=UPI00325B68ED